MEHPRERHLVTEPFDEPVEQRHLHVCAVAGDAPLEQSEAHVALGVHASGDARDAPGWPSPRHRGYPSATPSLPLRAFRRVEDHRSDS